MHYFLIGLSDNPQPELCHKALLLLEKHLVFSGGNRQYQIIKNKLPKNHIWIPITSKMDLLFDTYKTHSHIVIFTSGDPLFYGFAHTIQKYQPQAKCIIIPYFSSLQLLCHKTQTSYSAITYTSVHGRSWKSLDCALLQQKPLIGVLTDIQKSPKAIAQRLLDYNYTNYTLIVGENLEGPTEKISFLTLENASQQDFQPLNCVLLIQTKQKQKPFGIPDNAFEILPNRPNMITKLPIRLCSLSQLDLHNKSTFWDIGFCTGSVSIEAQLQFAHLNITAFEIRPECQNILQNNAKKYGALGIQTIMGDFYLQDLSQLSAPDSIFIGGHGNKLNQLIPLLNRYLLPQGRLVINAVKPESQLQFIQNITALNYQLLPPITLKVNQHNQVTILTAQKK